MITLKICQIWQTDAKITEENIHFDVDSPRAGGKYRLHHGARDILDSLHDPEKKPIKARLTTWLIDQRRLGIEWPVITTSIIDQIGQQKPLLPHERADRLLRYLAKRTATIGKPVECRLENQNPVAMEMLAWSESLTLEESLFLANYLAEMHWVDKSRNTMGMFMPTITVGGYARIAILDAEHVNSSQAFVAMWFPGKENMDYAPLEDAYENGIRPGIKDAGYEALRIDKKEHNNKIDDEIIAEIRRSRFLVADFTHGNDGARGGVYYEAGFAMGLNIPVIFTCREGMTNKLHFDTRQYPHIVWETPEDLREQLKNRITASEIGWGPNKQPPK